MRKVFTWANAGGSPGRNPYISAADTIRDFDIDPLHSITEQLVDAYGNVTETRQHAWGPANRQRGTGSLTIAALFATDASISALAQSGTIGQLATQIWVNPETFAGASTGEFDGHPSP